MSICTRINRDIGRALSTAGAGASRAYRFSSACAKRILKIGTSVLGKKTVLSIRENVAEFIAYYVGAELAAPYGKKVGSQAGAFVGTAATAGLALVAVNNTASYLKQRTAHLSRPARHLISAAMLISIICCISDLTGESFQEVGSRIGGLLGETIAYYGGGILAAFLAIKLTGSEEILWQHSSKIRTYPIKTIVSMAGVAVINERFPILQTRYVQPVTDLIIGSLIYNSLDLFEAYLKMREGRLLDGAFPKALPDPGYFDAALKPASHQLVDVSVGSMVCRDSAFLTSLLSDLTPLLQSSLKDLCDSYIPSQSPSFDQLRHLTAQKASEAIMRGVNLYLEILELHPDILNHAGTAANFLERAASVLDQPLQSDPLQRYSAFRKHLLTQLFEELTNVKLGPDLPSDLPKIPRFITPQHIDFLTERCMEQIQSTEEATFGFSLSGEKEQRKLHAFLERHLENIVKCIILCAPATPVPFQDREARNFYANLMGILANHYNSVLGPTLSSGIADFFKHQASHSDLA